MNYLCCVDEYSEWNTGCIGYELLTRSTAAFMHEENSYAARFVQLVAQHFSDSEFSIDKAAKELDIHRSTLTRQMLKKYGMSPLQ